MYEDITCRVDDNVTTITIQRPAARNALRLQTYDELEDAISSSDARCIVLTGSESTFCSGDDVKMTIDHIDTGATRSVFDLASPRLSRLAEVLLYCDTPVIAAINGAAVGWGMELALLADLRVASEQARFAEFFVLRGMCCDVAGLGRLAQLVGREKAAELLFTGEMIDAAEAARIGLVGRVVPHDELMPTAHAIARRIAANAPLAVRRLKAGLRKALDPDWRELGEWVTASFGFLFETEDSREGFVSFLEKRPPVFVGR